MTWSPSTVRPIIMLRRLCHEFASLLGWVTSATPHVIKALRPVPLTGILWSSEPHTTCAYIATYGWRNSVFVVRTRYNQYFSCKTHISWPPQATKVWEGYKLQEMFCRTCRHQKLEKINWMRMIWNMACVSLWTNVQRKVQETLNNIALSVKK